MSRLLPSTPDVSLGDREPRVVGVEDEDAADLIAALSSETARNVLAALHEEPATTSELADQLDTSLQNVQYHLGNLTDTEVVEVVDTVYSEKGREMNVYAPADEPLVLFAGRSTDSSGIKTALKRLLGGYGVLGLAALAVQSTLTANVPGAPTADGEAGGGDAADTGADDVGAAEVEEDAADAGEPAADAETAETPAPEAEPSAGHDAPSTYDGAEAAAEYAMSIVEPGVVFFLGAALVFTLAWVYWYRSDWRRLG